MYYPSKPEAGRLHKEDCLIPLKKEIRLNIKPQELYRRLQCNGLPGGMSFILESCRTHPRTGRFSFAAAEPFLIFKSKGSDIQIIKNCSGAPRRTATIRGNPISIFRSLLNKYKSQKVPGINGFTGGAAGYFSYDCCHLFEKLPRMAKDDLLLPDMYFIFVDTLCVFDHLENKTCIISNIYPDKPIDAAYDEAVEKIERLVAMLLAGERVCGCAGVRVSG